MPAPQPNEKCPRCSAGLRDDRDVAAGLERALSAIEGAKLRWPVGVTTEVRELVLAMRCRLGTCDARGER